MLSHITEPVVIQVLSGHIGIHRFLEYQTRPRSFNFMHERNGSVLENTKNKIIYNKLCGFVDGLIKEEPPFDDIHQLESMITIYKNYINSYHELEGDFRTRIIESLRYDASTSLRVPFFDLEEWNRMDRPELRSASHQFQEWYRNKHMHEYESFTPMSEDVDGKGILKSEIPERYPGLKYNRLKNQSFFASFVENLYDDVNLLVCFSKSSQIFLRVSIGATEPNGLEEPYLMANIGDYFGGGNFVINFNSHKEFDHGRKDLYKFLDFFLPKFKNTLLEARQEWTKVGS